MGTRTDKRNLELADHTILHLQAWFEGRSDKECAFVCDTAEDALVLFNDRKARKMLAETMGRPEREPLKRIPTDDVMAAMLKIPLEELRAARKSGRMDGYFSFGRSAGRRPLDRTALYLNWMVPWPVHGDPAGLWDDPHLSLSICEADVPPDGGLREGAFVRRFFERAAATGVCWYASARLYPLHRRNWQGGHADIHEPPDLMEMVWDRLWSALKAARRAYVPAVRHIQLLSPAHLAKLGGRAALVKEIKSYAKSDPPGYPPVAEPMDHGALCVWADEHILDSEGGGMRADSMAVIGPKIGATWLAVRFAQAGLLIHQAPEAMAALRRSEEETKSRLEQSRDTRAERTSESLDADLAAREAAFYAFMARMWGSPPTFIARHAHPVGKAHRAAIARSGGGRGENLTAFLIARTSDEPVALFMPRSSHGELTAPYFIGGPTRAAALAVFDPSKHGFDGENGLGRKPSSKTPDAYHCTRCGHDRFFVTAKFEYSEPEDIEDAEELRRPQDFFSWFYLDAKCAGCKHRAEIASVECA